MSDIWYKLNPSWSVQRITPVEILSSTGQTITLAINGRRHNRITGYECYFPTKEEARAHAIQDAETEVETTRIQHARAISALDVARKIKL